MNQHRFFEIAFGLSMVSVACTGEVSEQDHPCPCSSGWTCCENVCLAPGSPCSPAVDSGTAVKNDAASGNDATTGASEAGETGDASPAADAAQGDRCSGAMTITSGQSIQGTTCGGATGFSAPCGSNPVVFVVVDAPDSATVEVTVSAGVQLLIYPTCQSDLPVECTTPLSSMFEADSQFRVFGVERYDTNCGDFTVSVGPPSDTTGDAPDAGPGGGDGGLACPPAQQCYGTCCGPYASCGLTRTCMNPP